jgi:hypothetical protein
MIFGIGAEPGHHKHRSPCTRMAIDGADTRRSRKSLSSWDIENRILREGMTRRPVDRAAGLAMAAKQSVDFCGYWQRHIRS